MPVIATLPNPDQLVPEHPCRFKPVYHAMYVQPIRDALEAIGVEVRPAEKTERGIIVRFAFPDGMKISAIVDYADQVHIDGLVKFAEGEFDFVFKMKPCDRFNQEYVDFTGSIPQSELSKAVHGDRGIDKVRRIHPYGYVIAPTYSGNPDDCRKNREWFFENLIGLRQIRDGFDTAFAEKLVGKLLSPPVRLLTRGAFHAIGACPERQRLYDPDYDQGGKEYDFKQHMLDVARAEFVLNACGPDNTIDRKVVEFCAIGSVILSNDGLKDLILPWGGRFVHGENVWFVSNPAEVKATVASMPEDVRQKLIRGSRALWDRCFEPASIGQWLLKCAAEEAYS